MPPSPPFATRILDWLTVLVVVLLLADEHHRARNRRVMVEGFEKANRIREAAIAAWTEEDLRAEVRRLRVWCWTWAAILVAVGVPLLIFDLVTGGLGHAH